MKILALHPSSELYGADRIFLSVIKVLSNTNVVDVVIKSDGPLKHLLDRTKVRQTIIKHNLPVAVRSSLSFASLLGYAFNCMCLARFFYNIKGSYEVIYVNTLALFVCAPIAKIIGFKKIVVHSHEIISNHGRLAKLMVAIVNRFSDKIICVSKAVQDDMLCNVTHINQAKHIIVHNGIDDICLDRMNNRDGFNEKTNFLLVGRIMPEKGQWFVLKSLMLMNSSDLKKLHVTFVGSPPPNRSHLSSQLSDLISEFKLNEFVTILPFTDNPASMINKTDVCLVPSIMADPFPTTVIEAMSCSKPVIVTNNGGATEIVVDKFNGIIVEPNDCLGLINAMLYFVKNKNDIILFGERGRDKYLQKLNLESFEKNITSAILA